MFDYAAEIAAKRKWFRTERTSMLQIRHSWADFLKEKDCNVTSQNGEDGLIAALFDKLGARNSWCFEVGATDGLELSNTWALREAGWRAVLIEADGVHFDELVRRFGERVYAVHERIGLNSLDRILDEAGAPADLDLGVIDIDGQDLQVWDGLRDFRPRVVLIEYNAGGTGYLGGHFVGGKPVWQAGYDDIAALGKAKGYEPVATTGHNAFFVDRGEMK